MIAILSLVLVLLISFLVTRVATVALTHTGLSTEVARFQARSALTGAGFTTSESERLVNHPVRRRILMLLMLAGNAGIITAVSSLILAFVGDQQAANLAFKVVFLVVALLLLWLVANSHWVERRLSRIVDHALRRYTSLEVRDFASLLGLSGDYRIVEILISDSHWLQSKTLRQSAIGDEGVLVLAVQKADGKFLGAPDPDTVVCADDMLIAYGHVDALHALDERRRDVAGQRDHSAAIRRQRQRVEQEHRLVDQ